MSGKLIHGFHQQELEALQIPNKFRNQCLRYLVPLKRCQLNIGLFNKLIGSDQCQDLQRDALMCIQPIKLRQTLATAFLFKKNDPKRFEEEKISPSLEKLYSPVRFMDINVKQH